MIITEGSILAASATVDYTKTLQGLIPSLIACTATFLVIFWLSLVIWAFRDIRARSQDILTQVLATVLVAVFPIGGLFIYLILRPRQTLAEIYERQLEEESLLAEMTERQTCNNCHARIESDFQVCPSCGQKLKRACPKCERLLELRWTFCPYCATNLVGGPGPMPSMPGMPVLGRPNNPPSSAGIPPNNMPPGMPNNMPPGMPSGMPMGPAGGNRY